jgi:phytol kinase
MAGDLARTPSIKTLGCVGSVNGMVTMARLLRTLGAAHICSIGTCEGAARYFGTPAFASQSLTKLTSASVSNTASAPIQQKLRLDSADIPLWLGKIPSDKEEINVGSIEHSKQILLPIAALVSLSVVSLAAFNQFLPGPLIDATAPPPLWGTFPFGVIFSGSCEPYTPSLIYRDISSTLLCIVGATLFVKAITYPAARGWLESRDARKIIHTLSAPLFVLLWPIFSNAYGARVFASIVPLLNALRLFLAGTGGGNDNRGAEAELASAISRSGDAKESLGGPFIYVVILLVCTLIFWTDSHIGVVSVATMAGGDGLADLIGRRVGTNNKWIFNKSKSVAGSAAFVFGSFCTSFGLISWLTSTGALDTLGLSSMALVWRLLSIAFICAGVELIPVVDDNWSVPLSAALLSAILLS